MSSKTKPCGNTDYLVAITTPESGSGFCLQGIILVATMKWRLQSLLIKKSYVTHVAPPCRGIVHILPLSSLRPFQYPVSWLRVQAALFSTNFQQFSLPVLILDAIYFRTTDWLSLKTLWRRKSPTRNRKVIVASEGLPKILKYCLPSYSHPYFPISLHPLFTAPDPVKSSKLQLAASQVQLYPFILPPVLSLFTRQSKVTTNGKSLASILRFSPPPPPPPQSQPLSTLITTSNTHCKGLRPKNICYVSKHNTSLCND